MCIIYDHVRIGTVHDSLFFNDRLALLNLFVVCVMLHVGQYVAVHEVSEIFLFTDVVHHLIYTLNLFLQRLC
jgi:hypothetical protein